MHYSIRWYDRVDALVSCLAHPTPRPQGGTLHGLTALTLGGRT